MFGWHTSISENPCAFSNSIARLPAKCSRSHKCTSVMIKLALLNRTPKILRVTLDNPFNFDLHARDCVERISRALNVMKALTGSKWGFTTENLMAPNKAIVRHTLNYGTSHLVQPIILLPSGQTGGDPEQGSEDGDWMPPKACDVPPQSLDWGSSLEGGLCSQQYYASYLQPMHPSNLISSSPTPPPFPRPSPPQGHPPGLISPYPEKPESKRCQPQRPSCHLWRHPGGRRISFGQTPPTRPDDLGGLTCPTRYCGLSHHQWIQPNSCCPVPIDVPSPSSPPVAASGS